MGLSALLAPAAEAGPKRCGERARIVAHLGEKYGEVRRSVGLQAGRGIVELFANAESGSWTLLLTSPRGITCLMAAGSSFRAVEPGPPGAPA